MQRFSLPGTCAVRFQKLIRANAMRSQTDDSEMRQASCAGEPNTADYPAMREEEVIGWLQKPWIFRTFAQSMAYAALAAMRRIVAADSGATCPAPRDH